MAGVAALVAGSEVWFGPEPWSHGKITEVTGDDRCNVAPTAGGALVPSKLSELHLANDSKASHPDDACGLVNLNEPALLHSTLERATRGQIYTWVGASQLLSVNPCEGVDGLFGEAAMERFRGRAHELGTSVPHTYAVAEAACMRLHRQRCVSVLVSGESGAGKTEAMRCVLQYLVWRASAGEARTAIHAEAKARASAVREGVLASTTVLEALGNAQMVANSNSSRFGKHVLLQVEPAADPSSPIVLQGATTTCFLLEKCRLCSFARGECNFHVLYYMLAGTRSNGFLRMGGGGGHPATLLADGSAMEPGAYHYLQDVEERPRLEPGASGAAAAGAAGRSLDTTGARYDARESSGAAASKDAAMKAGAAGYDKLLSALKQLGMGTKAQSALLRVLRAVLALGELAFVSGALPGDPPPPADPRCISSLTKLLGEDVHPFLLSQSIASPRTGTTLTKANTAEQACALRDALAMALYQAAFDATLGLINARLAPAETSLTPSGSGRGGAGAGAMPVGRGVALLDVFGFEVLAANSLEQLLINYTNEKLHQHFLRCTIREDENAQRAEGVAEAVLRATRALPCEDNEALLVLLEGPRSTLAPTPGMRRPPSLFGLLEAQCRMQSGKDQRFVQELFGECGAASGVGLLLRPAPSAAQLRALAPDEGFQLAHFHSRVQYSAVGFVHKNRDELTPALNALVERQATQLRAELGLDGDSRSSCSISGGGASAAGVGGGGTPPRTPTTPSSALPLRGASRGPRTLSEGHRLRLAELLASLDPDRDVHNFFIKCIKPNARLAPRVHERAYSLRQLRQQGVLQAVSLIKQGYPHRIGYAEVHLRYSPLLRQLAEQPKDAADRTLTLAGTQRKGGSVPRGAPRPPHSLASLASVGPRELVEALLSAEELKEGSDYVLGKTRVFLRLGRAAFLERMLSLPPERVLPELEARLQAQSSRRWARLVILRGLRRFAKRRKLRRRKQRARHLLLESAYRYLLFKRGVSQLRRAVAAAAAHRARRAAEMREAEEARYRSEREAEESAARVRADAEARAAKVLAKKEAAAKAKAAKAKTEAPSEMLQRTANEAGRGMQQQPGMELTATEASRQARIESTWPRLPLFLPTAAQYVAATKGLPADLALDPALHRFLFADWQWKLASPPLGAGVVLGTSAGSSGLAQHDAGLRHRFGALSPTAKQVAITIAESPSPLRRPRGSGGGEHGSSRTPNMTPTTSKRALEEPLDELTKRALGLGILALLFASWGGIFLIEWIVVHGGVPVPPEVAAITSSMEVDDWVALAVTAVPLLSLFVALPRLGFGLLSLLFAWWAGSVVSQWIVVHGPPEVAAITSSMEVDDWVALAVTALPLLSLFVALCRGSGVASSAPGATDT
jgi:myosin heavy subunit